VVKGHRAVKKKKRKFTENLGKKKKANGDALSLKESVEEKRRREGNFLATKRAAEIVGKAAEQGE